MQRSYENIQGNADKFIQKQNPFYWLIGLGITILILIILIIAVASAKEPCLCPVQIITTIRSSSKPPLTLIPIFTTPPTPPNISLDGLVGFWPMNDKYLLCDASPNNISIDDGLGGVGMDLELAPGPWGHSNASYRFKGNANSYFRLTSTYPMEKNAALNTKNEITILAKVANYHSSGPLFAYSSSCQNAEYSTSLWINAEEQLTSRLFTTTSDGFQNCSSIDNPLLSQKLLNGPKWIQVALSFNHGFSHLYIDGLEVDSAKETFDVLHTASVVVYVAKIDSMLDFLGVDMACLVVFDKALDDRELHAADVLCRDVHMYDGPGPILEPSCAKPYLTAQ